MATQINGSSQFSFLSDAGEEIISRAIMAERKRCAEIASGFESKYAQARDEATNDIEYKMWNAGSYAAMDIASAIMGEEK